MAAGFAFHARNPGRNGFRVDLVLFAAILTGDLHDGHSGCGRCFRRMRLLRGGRPKRDGISAGFAFGIGHSAWDPVWVNIVDFFAF